MNWGSPGRAGLWDPLGVQEQRSLGLDTDPAHSSDSQKGFALELAYVTGKTPLPHLIRSQHREACSLPRRPVHSHGVIVFL